MACKWSMTASASSFSAQTVAKVLSFCPRNAWFGSKVQWRSWARSGVTSRVTILDGGKNGENRGSESIYDLIIIFLAWITKKIDQIAQQNVSA